MAKPLSKPSAKQFLKCSLRSAHEKLTKHLPTPQGHTQMKVTDMAVSAVFVTTKVRTEVTQDCSVLLGFGPVPSGLGHHSRDGVFLDGMRSKDSCKELRYRKVN